MPAPFTPDPADPRYTYQQLADHIQAQIEAGDLQPGSRLPAVREAGDVWGVSAGTARRAVELLRERGLVHAKVTGTYVRRG